MKNDINKQISDIKRLILINEQCGGDLPQCEKDLEDNNYQVFNPNEQKAGCSGKQYVNDIYQIMKDNGVNDTQIVGPKTSRINKKNCFVMYMNPKMVKQHGRMYSVYNWTFYSNGQASFIETFDPSTDKYTTSEGENVFQYQYDGRITSVDNSAGTIKLEGFNFSGSFYDGNTMNLHPEEVYEINDGGDMVPVDELFDETITIKFSSGKVNFS